MSKRAASKISNATPLSRRGKVGMTLYLSENDHYRVKELALKQRKSITALHVEGVNLMLRSYGLKPIA